MWRITFATGLRQGEVLGISWEDFNSDTGGVFVRNQLQRQTGNGLVLKSILKANAEPREIILDAETAALMKVWRREQNQYQLQKGNWRNRGFVLTNELGEKYG